MVQQQEKAKITKAERERKTAEEQAEQLKKENEQKEIEKQRNFVIKKFEMLSSEQQETVLQTIFEQVGQGIFKVIEDNHLHFAPLIIYILPLTRLSMGGYRTFRVLANHSTSNS